MEEGDSRGAARHEALVAYIAYMGARKGALKNAEVHKESFDRKQDQEQDHWWSKKKLKDEFGDAKAKSVMEVARQRPCRMTGKEDEDRLEWRVVEDSEFRAKGTNDRKDWAW